MDLKISYSDTSDLSHQVTLPSSKSISNRLLIINALSGFNSDLQNLSGARDTRLMQALLQANNEVKNAKDAGTTYRFLTAYLALKNGSDYILEGEERMYARPIGILVDALRSLGAEIEYLKEEGYPPLKMEGRDLMSTEDISVSGSISSQFISALLLIGPYVKNGLIINLIPPVASEPYISMTIELMRSFGAEIIYENNRIIISEKKYTPRLFRVESDWSAACFFYSLATFSQSKYHLKNLQSQSLQADCTISDFMKLLGVKTIFNHEGIIIEGNQEMTGQELIFDCHACPDLVPALVVALGLKGVPAKLTRIAHLRYKESDRVAALQTEMAKVGVRIKASDDEMYISGQVRVEPHTAFDSYRDHRIAMSMAMLATQAPIMIQDAECVDKSFPDFWAELDKLGFTIRE